MISDQIGRMIADDKAMRDVPCARYNLVDNISVQSLDGPESKRDRQLIEFAYFLSVCPVAKEKELTGIFSLGNDSNS